jgi:hypothetical protein
VTLSSLSLESGNEIFVIENDFLIDILDHKLIRNYSKSSEIEIGRNVEILGSNCFSYCHSLSSITFESNSHLTRIESEAFSISSLQSIVIPSSVEILGSKCFSSSYSLSTITFESNSRLTRIESEAFSLSPLESILIPNAVEILGSRCFSWCKSLSSIRFESNSRLTRIESEAFSFSSLQSVLIPMNVEILGPKCFAHCDSLSSITFESDSCLTQIESEVFSYSSLQSILIPRNVEILGSKCFSSCQSLSSITFESNSHLIRIESKAFYGSSLQSLLIPSTILFIASDAVNIASQIRLIDGDCCPEFDRWLNLQRSGIGIDFRRIQKLGFEVRCLDDYIVNLSVFEERSRIWESDEIPNEIYRRIEDEFLVFLKSNPHSANVSESKMKQKLENLINLRHPCIAAPIGFVFPIESDSRWELKIVRLYLEGCSLLEVISVNPVWWTSTVKAKAIAGIVLGLRFAHSLGLVHGHLTMSNIVFDLDHCIEIVDFKPFVLEADETAKGTQLGWTPERDIQAFASILFELVFGVPPPGEASIPTGIPDFVSWIIESGLSPRSGRSYSFDTILEILKENDFRIEDDVNSREVSAFVSWVESTESSEK